MINLLARVFIIAFALLVAEYFIPGITITDTTTALVAALVLALLNLLVKPVLFILTLPITIITLGLFSFFINAGLFWFAAYAIEGFAVTSFWAALFGSLIVSVVNSIGSRFLA
jgi:putative membrane protein